MHDQDTATPAVAARWQIERRTTEIEDSGHSAMLSVSTGGDIGTTVVLAILAYTPYHHTTLMMTRDELRDHAQQCLALLDAVDGGS